jgi:hypothetical protein
MYHGLVAVIFVLAIVACVSEMPSEDRNPSSEINTVLADQEELSTASSFTEMQWRLYVPPPEQPPTPRLMFRSPGGDTILQTGVLIYDAWTFGVIPAIPQHPIAWPPVVMTAKDNVLGIDFGSIAEPHLLLLTGFDRPSDDEPKPIAFCSYFQSHPGAAECQGWQNGTWGVYLPKLPRGVYYLTVWAAWDYVHTSGEPSPKLATWAFAIGKE